MINIETSLIHSMKIFKYIHVLIPDSKMHSDGNFLKIRCVCFKVIIYLMRNQSLSSTFQRNISLAKILANAPLICISNERERERAKKK